MLNSYLVVLGVIVLIKILLVCPRKQDNRAVIVGN
jgi:hypothetical protein